MPSPSIPRSRSAPKISENPSISPSTSDVLLPAPSIKSLRSENSPRTYWPKKLNGFLLARKPSSSSSKNQKLTEESLKEFNRLNEILLEEKRYLSYSPYYRGLTDSSLVINPQMRASSPTPAPDTESHAATFFSSSSKSSIVHRMQEWGSSCFASPKHKDDRSSPSSSGRSNNRTTSRYTHTTTSSPTPSSRRKTANMAMTRETSKEPLKQPINENNEIRNSVKRTSDVPFTLTYEGKPLRERLSQSQPQPQPQPQQQPPSPPPTPPHPPLKKVAHQSVSPPSNPPQPAQPQQTTSPKISDTLTSQTQPADTSSSVPVKQSTMESEIKYLWADKYRPFTLKDFLCNRSTALQLQSLVKYPILVPCFVLIQSPIFFWPLLLYKLETEI